MLCVDVVKNYSRLPTLCETPTTVFTSFKVTPILILLHYDAQISLQKVNFATFTTVPATPFAFYLLAAEHRSYKCTLF